MPLPQPSRQIRHQQGFKVYSLRTASLELACVPELGARIVSLKDTRSGREWMWHPAHGLRLFRNAHGDDFSLSPLAGADECLPTIAPCAWRQRRLPDHGEVWSVPWQVEPAAGQAGTLKTWVDLTLSPFRLERTLHLTGNQVHLHYRLTNRGASEESFLWAFHPLLALQPEDRLLLPASTRCRLNGEPWLDHVGSARPAGGAAKLFAWPVAEGRAGVVNSITGAALWFEWHPEQLDTLGLWLTRGGWHGHHHFALEPTNGAPDALDRAAAQKRCGSVPPHGERQWKLTLTVQPGDHSTREN